MSIRVALQHHTQYNYDRMVYLSPHLIRLKPAAHTPSTIETFSLSIHPVRHHIHWQQDPFGNFVARVDFIGDLNIMHIQVEMIAVMEPVNPFDFFIDTYAEFFPFAYEARLKKDLAPYLETGEKGPYLRQWLQGIDQTRQRSVDFLLYLNQQVYQTVKYSVRMQPGVLHAEELLTQKVGSCRDSAWLLVQILRQIGLAARFVSGYLVQLSIDTVDNPDNMGPQEDSLALHAWAEVYLPGVGWIGLDPTSGMLVTEGHIPLSCTPEPMMAAPISGTAGQSNSRMTYTSTIVRLSN